MLVVVVAVVVVVVVAVADVVVTVVAVVSGEDGQAAIHSGRQLPRLRDHYSVLGHQLWFVQTRRNGAKAL